MSRDVCPSCGQPIPRGSYVTPRELDLLVAWWLTGSVRQAAERVDMAEQTAKNILARARNRNGVRSNELLLAVHLDSVRSALAEGASHNNAGAVA